MKCKAEQQNGAWVTYSVAKNKHAFHATNQFVAPKGDGKYKIQYLNEIGREGRLFETFNGKKFSKQPIGIRTICKVPQIVASFFIIGRIEIVGVFELLIIFF